MGGGGGRDLIQKEEEEKPAAPAPPPPPRPKFTGGEIKRPATRPSGGSSGRTVGGGVGGILNTIPVQPPGGGGPLDATPGAMDTGYGGLEDINSHKWKGQI